MTASRQGVSVVMPTVPGGRSLSAALNAVLGQDYGAPIECIVVVDGQAQVDLTYTPSPAPHGASRRVRQVLNTRTAGPSGARNTGIAEARYPLVAFCDDDDVWSLDKLGRQVAALEANPAAQVATCGVRFLTGARGFVRLPPGEAVTTGLLERSRRSEVHTSTLLARREFVVDDVGLFDESIPYGYGEDYDWVLRAARRAPLVAVRAPLVEVARTGSYFAGHWERVIPALARQLEDPARLADRRNRARVRGRLAFARAAVGQRRAALADALRSLRDSPLELRGYLAVLVACGVSASAVTAAGARFGRSV